MNFEELYKKIASLDVQETPITESDLAECPCGGDMSGPSKQQDTVNMNVSLNGQGSNGIRDLMDILRNIETGEDDSSPDDMIVGEPEEIIGDSYKNSDVNGSEEHVFDLAAINPTGDDLSSKGKEALKVNGGGNPQVYESLLGHLTSLYQEVKLR